MFVEDHPGGNALASGRVVVTHLGVGLADLVFGAAILERAAERGLGTLLGAVPAGDAEGRILPERAVRSRPGGLGERDLRGHRV